MAQTVPGALGLTATIRLVNRSTFIKDFGTLGLELEDRVRLVEEIRAGIGLVVVSSPAYNGAITTAYSIMSFLAQGQRDVLSIECPVHWQMEGVRQVEAELGPQGPRIEPTLRAMVAVRPDALMVSAVPDQGTASLVTQLASSLLVVAQVPGRERRARRGGAARARRALRQRSPARSGSSPRSAWCADLPHLPGAGRARRPRRRWRPTASRRRRRAASHSSRARAAPPATRSATAAGGRSSRRCRRSPEVRGEPGAGRRLEAIEKAALESGMIGIRERCLALVRDGTTSFDEFARLRL